MSTKLVIFDDYVVPTPAHYRHIKDSNLSDAIEFIFDSTKKQKPMRKLMQEVSLLSIFLLLYMFYHNPEIKYISCTYVKVLHQMCIMYELAKNG